MAPRASLLALAAASLAASVHATSRGLLQFTPAQSQNLANLQTQATAAQQAQQQAALQLAQAQAQVAQASEQLSAQHNQLDAVNAAQQQNVATLAVLLPETPSGAPAPGPASAQAAAALKRLEANSAMQGGIASIAQSFVYSPPPAEAPAPAPEPAAAALVRTEKRHAIHSTSSTSSEAAPAPAPARIAPRPDKVVDKGHASFDPGFVTYWETVPTARRALAQTSSDNGAYQQQVIALQQQIAASNAEATQDALAAASAQQQAANMQVQQRNVEANAEAKQAALTVQSQILAALAPVPAPAPAPVPAPAPAPESSASAALKAREASASMEGGVASMASRRLAQASLGGVEASAVNSDTQLINDLNGWVQSSDAKEMAHATEVQSTEQQKAESNDATDNFQLTSQEEQNANQETQKPKIPALTAFEASPPPPRAHAKLKKAEKAGELSGGIASMSASDD